MTEPQPTHLEQIKRALDAGVIDQDTFDAAVAAVSARLDGSGAIAQGQDALAVGAGGVGVRGDNEGVINLGVLIQQAARPGASKEDLRRAYLARILTQADQLPLFASDGSQAQIRLSSVYTALLTQRSEDDAAIKRAMPNTGLSPERAGRRLSALDVLNAEKKLVLLGSPGSGKSTFVNFVALSSQLPPPGAPVNAKAVWDFIRGRLKQAALGAYTLHLEEELHDRGGLVLLDGLDEVPDALNRRVQLKQAVQDFTAT